jgi:hypothetical protein
MPITESMNDEIKDIREELLIMLAIAQKASKTPTFKVVMDDSGHLPPENSLSVYPFTREELYKKIVNTLRSNLSKEEMIAFHDFMDGESGDTFFHDFLTSAIVEIAPELFTKSPFSEDQE